MKYLVAYKEECPECDDGVVEMVYAEGPAQEACDECSGTGKVRAFILYEEKELFRLVDTATLADVQIYELREDTDKLLEASSVALHEQQQSCVLHQIKAKMPRREP